MRKKLSKARESIDKVDIQIAKLIDKRARLALEVGKAKGASNASIYVPSREKEVLKNVIKAGKGILSDEAFENIYTEIISACRNLEQPTKVAF